VRIEAPIRLRGGHRTMNWSTKDLAEVYKRRGVPLSLSLAGLTPQSGVPA
jgi:hypothetical protein